MKRAFDKIAAGLTEAIETTRTRGGVGEAIERALDSVKATVMTGTPLETTHASIRALERVVSAHVEEGRQRTEWWRGKCIESDCLGVQMQERLEALRGERDALISDNAKLMDAANYEANRAEAALARAEAPKSQPPPPTSRAGRAEMGSSRPQHWVLFVADNRVSPFSATFSDYITDRQIISALRNRAERSALIRRAQANREHRDLMAMPLPSGGGSR